MVIRNGAGGACIETDWNGFRELCRCEAEYRKRETTAGFCGGILASSTAPPHLSECLMKAILLGERKAVVPIIAGLPGEKENFLQKNFIGVG